MNKWSVTECFFYWDEQMDLLFEMECDGEQNFWKSELLKYFWWAIFGGIKL